MPYEIDFIPVGNGEQSGDAIALRFGNLAGGRNEYKVVVVDGGFKDSGGKQLVSHIQKYYNTSIVDLAISTHPDSDHISGLETVMNELTVKQLWMHQPWNHTSDIAKMFKDGRVTDTSVKAALKRSLDDALDLEKLAKSKNIQIIEPFTGVQFANSLFVVGPTKAYYETLLPGFRGTPEPAKTIAELLAKMTETVTRIAETFDIETLNDKGETSAENNSSVILLLSVDQRYSLLTSDAGIPALSEAIRILDHNNIECDKIRFIQVPHHGSKHNIGPAILDKLIGPKLKEEKTIKTAFVSVSKDSDSKHPSKKVTNAFKRRGAHVHDTSGFTKCHRHEAPARPDFSASTPLPFYNEVED